MKNVNKKRKFYIKNVYTGELVKCGSELKAFDLQFEKGANWKVVWSW